MAGEGKVEVRVLPHGTPVARSLVTRLLNVIIALAIQNEKSDSLQSLAKNRLNQSGTAVENILKPFCPCQKQEVTRRNHENSLCPFRDVARAVDGSRRVRSARLPYPSERID
jgi:hypothetical protein